MVNSTNVSLDELKCCECLFQSFLMVKITNVSLDELSVVKFFSNDLYILILAFF